MKAGLAIAELDRNEVINRAALKNNFPELEAGDMRFNVRKYVMKESTDTIFQLSIAGTIVCAVAIVTILVERRTNRTQHTAK